MDTVLFLFVPTPSETVTGRYHISIQYRVNKNCIQYIRIHINNILVI